MRCELYSYFCINAKSLNPKMGGLGCLVSDKTAISETRWKEDN